MTRYPTNTHIKKSKARFGEMNTDICIAFIKENSFPMIMKTYISKFSRSEKDITLCKCMLWLICESKEKYLKLTDRYFT